jgi:hypothetical protein
MTTMDAEKASELQRLVAKHDALQRELYCSAQCSCADELRKELLAHWMFMARHIQNDPETKPEDKCAVLLHAICASIDGVSGQFEHSVDLGIDGELINDGVMLHEELAR